VIEALLRGAVQAHIMGAPKRGEFLTARGKLADKVGEIAVEWIAPDLRPQPGDAFSRGPIPVGVELFGARVEIGEAGHVRRGRRFEHQ
jgi:hypothetical protein